MVFKMVLTFSFLITSIMGSDLSDLPPFLQKIYNLQKWQEINKQNQRDWLDLDLNRPILPSRDDEDLYGEWELYDMYDYPDSTYTDGTSLIDLIIAFDLNLTYTFYSDNTIFIETSLFGYEESGSGDWWTEGDSLFVSVFNYYYYEEELLEVKYELFDYDDETQGLSIFLSEIDEYGEVSYGETRFYYAGSADTDDECVEEGEVYCESGDFQDIESCEDETICAWDEDQCWYDCENDDNCDCDEEEEDSDNCGDTDACNYSPDSDPYEDENCWYAEDEGWCDCDGNIPDCSGECGGENMDSCTIMYLEAAGFYENSDCTGELITHRTGMCLTDDYNYYDFFYFSEEECLEDGGLWLAAETCYTVSYEIMSQEECEYSDGFVFDESITCVFDEMPSQEDCETQGGYYNYYTGECFINDELSCTDLGGTWDLYTLCGGFNEAPFDTMEDCYDNYYFYAIWIESANLFEGGPPNLYFFNDGTFSETCEEDCQFTNMPLEEDCGNAGGEYVSWGDCSFEEMPSEEACESQGGYYDYYNNECYVDDENACSNLSGIWDGEEECYVENENSCTALNGTWYDGICPVGEYSVDGNTMTITFYQDEGPDEFDEITVDMDLDETGNWVSMEWIVQDWYGYGNCIGFIWSSTPYDLSIIDPGMSLPEDLSIKSIYPNPFNPKTKIQYTLPVHAEVSISVYDIKGKQMDEIMIGRQNAGQHSVVWNANQLSSGVYFIRLQADDKIQSRNVILVK